MKCCNKQRIREQIRRKRDRLQLYLDREREILEGGVRAYGIGSRNITRYETALSDVRAEIDKLEQEIAELEGLLCGSGARKAAAVIIRDW